MASSTAQESKGLLGDSKSPARQRKQILAYAKGTKYTAIAIEGGGTKGIAYAGMVKRMEEAGLMKDIKKFAGTSAGAQNALFLAIGHSSAEMTQINQGMDWDRIFDMPKGCCATLRSLHRAVGKLAVCGSYLGEHLEEIVQKKTGKSKLTFQQLYELYGVEFKAGVSNLTKQKFEMLSRETNPNMPVALAAMASSTLPGIFPPIRYEGNLYCDGGCAGNLPARAFPGAVTLACHLHPDEPAASSGDADDAGASLGAYLGAVITTMWRGAQAAGGLPDEEENMKKAAEGMRSHMNVDVVHVDCGDCGAVETDLPADRMARIERLGYDSMDDFLAGRLR